MVRWHCLRWLQSCSWRTQSSSWKMPVCSDPVATMVVVVLTSVSPGLLGGIATALHSQHCCCTLPKTNASVFAPTFVIALSNSYLLTQLSCFGCWPQNAKLCCCNALQPAMQLW